MIHAVFLLFSLVIMPSVAHAHPLRDATPLDFGAVHLERYADAPWDRATNVAVSALTTLGVVEGNPHPDDPSGESALFLPYRVINRAEFLHIVMRLLAARSSATVREACFPDVAPSAWYAATVCHAKTLGLVRGNAVTSMPASQWRFEPERPVRVEEAAKIVVTLLGYDVHEAVDTVWFAPFMDFLEDANLGLPALQPGSNMQRGYMAQLTTALLAHRFDRLDDWRAAVHASSVSASSFGSSSSSSSSSSSAMSSFSVVSEPSLPVDSYGSVDGGSHLLLLGTVSPVLAGVRFFSGNEPIDTDAVTVTLAQGAVTVGSLLVFDQDGRQWGTAARVGNSNDYRIAFGQRAFRLPHHQERSLYFRARTLAYDSGGMSGQKVHVGSVRLEGVGVWSSERYAVDSTDVFPVHETARGEILSIMHAGPADAVITAGSGRMIAAFSFAGSVVDSTVDLALKTLRFTVVQSAHITLSNVQIGRAGSAERAACTVSSTIILCDALPLSIGGIDESATVRLYADVALDGALPGNRFLRVRLHDPGYPGQPGDVTWTDGTATFTWLDLDPSLAEGTVWR